MFKLRRSHHSIAEIQDKKCGRQSIRTFVAADRFFNHPVALRGTNYGTFVETKASETIIEMAIIEMQHV